MQGIFIYFRHYKGESGVNLPSFFLKGHMQLHLKSL